MGTEVKKNLACGQGNKHQFDHYFYWIRNKFCLVCVYISVNMLRSGTNSVIARQPINQMGKLGYFHHLKQRSKEQKLTRKRTVERCDVNTKIVVIKAKRLNVYQISQKMRLKS